MTKKPTKVPARKKSAPPRLRATARPSTKLPPRAATQHNPLDAYVDAAVEILGIAVDSAWKPAIKANLQVTLQIAALVDQFALPDEVEPAPVYGA